MLPQVDNQLSRPGDAGRSSTEEHAYLNPYDAPNDAAERTKDQPTTRADLMVYGLYAMTALGLLSLAYLPLRYPNLTDLSNGPAYYWPEDLLRALVPAVSLLGTFSTLVFAIRTFTRSRSTRPNT